MEHYRNSSRGTGLDFVRPGKSVENALIVSARDQPHVENRRGQCGVNKSCFEQKLKMYFLFRHRQQYHIREASQLFQIFIFSSVEGAYTALATFVR